LPKIKRPDESRDGQRRKLIVLGELSVYQHSVNYLLGLYHEMNTEAQETSKKTEPKTPPLSAIFALYDVLAAVGYVVNLKPVAGCNLRGIEAA
jgi:hypothetical protein